MKKINISDLFEQEDVFKGIRKSAIDTIETLQKVQSELKESAKVIQNDIKNSSTNSAKGLKEFSDAAKAASQVMKDSAAIAKQQAQAEQQRIKVDQELIKLEKLKAQEIARANKEAEKAAKLAANEASAYSKLSAELNNARKAYKDLAVTNQTNTQEAQDLLNTINKLDKQLKQVDATVGQHQRNVGNYEGATRNLKTELRALTRELMNMETSDPRFQEMTQRAGELKDQISDTQAVVKATAGSAIENLGGAMANAGQIGIAAFQGIESSMVLMGVESEAVLQSMQKLQALAGLSDALGVLGGIGDKLNEMSAGFSAFGNKAIGAFNGMTNAGKAFAVTGIGLIVTALGYAVANWDKVSASINKQTAAQKLSNQITTQAIGTIANELSAADKLQRQLKSETLTRGEKIQKVKEFQAAYPGLLQNMNLETMSIDQINTQLIKNIELLKIQAEQKAIEAIRSDKLQQKIKTQLDELSIAQENATNWTIDYGETAANGWIGFSTGAENAAKAQKKFSDIQTVGTKAIDKDIAALDKQSDANDKKIALMIKGGAQNKENIKDLSKNTHHINLNTKALQENVDLRREIVDEQVKAIQDEGQRTQTELIIQAQRRIEDIQKTVADKKQKATLIKQIEENLITELDKLDQAWYDKSLEAQRQSDANKLKAKNEFLDKIEEITEANTRRTMSDQEVEERDVNDKYFALEEAAKGDAEALKQIEIAKMNELNDIRLKYQNIDYDNKKAATDKEKELDKKKNEEMWQTTQEFAQKTTDYFKEKSEERIKQIDKEIAAAEKQADYYRELAANGNINAQQSLAEQERIIAESNRRKEREQKRQQRMELANTIYQTYAGHAAKDPETALMKTIKDASLLQAFISTLPMFYDGTEDTGRGGGVDGKGGFHAVLHPHERVIPKSLNDQIGNLTNEQLTNLAMQYQNGKLVGKDIAHSSLDLAILVNEMKDLKEIIRSKPETNIELGEITQSAMEIVKSTRKGNTTVYNRFKVRS